MPRILLVEDDKDLVFLLEHLLRASGYEVDVARTVREACSSLDRRSYDLLVADGRLEDGTGMEIADKAVEQGTKALIITGYAFLLPREALARYPYLLKPVRPNELLTEIERVLQQPSTST